MEITARPRRRGWLRVVRVVLLVTAGLVVALLIPPALGYQTHVVGDHSMAGTYARGSLVFDELVSQRQLEVGDVVTFMPPGADPTDGPVTRRIVAIDDVGFWTQGDSAPVVDPWRVPLADGELERVAFSLPWAGYPVIALRSLAVPPWTPAAVALGLAVALVMLRRGSRPVAEPEREADARAPSGARVVE